MTDVTDVRRDLASAILSTVVWLGQKHLAGQHDQSTHGHGSGAMPGALSDVPAKGNFISPKEGVEIASGIAEAEGIDPSIVKYSGGKYEFEINGQNYEAAGLYTPSQSGPGKITLYNHALETEYTATTISAHEVQHARYAAVKKTAMNEYYRARGRGDLLSDGRTINPDVEKKYPAYTALHRHGAPVFMSEQEATPRAHQLISDDGITSYSAAYWGGYRAGKVSLDTAMNETLAEVAAVRRGKMTLKDVSPAWNKFYDDVSGAHAATRRPLKPKSAEPEAGKSLLSDLAKGEVFIVTMSTPFEVDPLGEWVVISNLKGEMIVAKRVQPEAEAKSFTPDEKALHWKAIDKTATKWEPEYSDSAIAALESDKREILAIVGEAGQKALQMKASINWLAVIDAVEAYIATVAPENWRAKFTPALEGLITEQGERWAVVLGTQFDVQNFFAGDWFNTYTLKFSKPINDTTLEGLSNVLQQAQIEGWSNSQTQNRITTMFDQWMHGEKTREDFQWYADRMPPHRTEMIARTETMRASNAGSNELFNEWGVKKHEWLSTMDDRVRGAHRIVNGQVRDIDQPFDVGGEQLMYPGDPSGRPDNTINCRCTALPVMEG